MGANVTSALSLIPLRLARRFRPALVGLRTSRTFPAAVALRAAFLNNGFRLAAVCAVEAAASRAVGGRKAEEVAWRVIARCFPSAGPAPARAEVPRIPCAIVIAVGLISIGDQPAVVARIGYAVIVVVAVAGVARRVAVGVVLACTRC